MLSLSAGLVSGLVPPDKAFHGFSDPVVVVVAAALVVSAGIERSGIIERLMRPLSGLKSPDAIIGTLDNGLPLIERVTDEAIAALGAEAVGAMRTAHAMTIDYARQRKQFGVPISSFQVL